MIKHKAILSVGLLMALTACSKNPLGEIQQMPDKETTKVDAATVYTPTLDASRNILLNATGYNPKFMKEEEPWGQTSPKNFQAAWVDSKANMTRYPGGTWGSFFDYDKEKMFPRKATYDPNGWVNTAKIDNVPISDNIVNDAQKINSIADLKYAVNNAGKTMNVVYQMNMITPGWDYYQSVNPGWSAPNPGSNNLNDTWYKMLDDRYERFKRMLLRAKGGSTPLTIRFIELGNEYYFDDEYQVEAFRGGGDYGKAANYIAAKLKNDTDLNLPSNVRIAATGSCVTGAARATDWNANLKTHLDKNLVPYVTLHVYKQFVEPTTYNELNFQTQLVDWYQKVNNKIVNSSADAMFISPSGENPWGIWYTEMNANWDGGTDDANPVDQRSWAQSLVEAYSAQYLYDRGNADMYLQFQYNNQVRDNADIVNGLRLYNRALALMPFMEASAEGTSCARVSFAGTTMPKLPSSTKAVVSGYLFTTSAGVQNCFFINLSATEKHLNLGANIFSGGGSTLQVKSYHNNSISTIAVPTLTNTTANKTDVTLPPYSVSYIRR